MNYVVKKTVNYEARTTLLMAFMYYALAALFIVLSHTLVEYDATLPRVKYYEGYYDHPNSYWWVEFFFAVSMTLALYTVIGGARSIVRFSNSKGKGITKNQDSVILGIHLVILALFFLQPDVRLVLGLIYLIIGILVIVGPFFPKRWAKRETKDPYL